MHFLREQTGLAHQSVNAARATLCELIASRILRRFHEDHTGESGLLLLAHILVEGFDPFQGAPVEVATEWRQPQWPIQERGGHERKLTALELAILSESKSLIATAAFQKVIHALYDGQVTYTPLSFIDILPDHHKHQPISIYNAKQARLLNHYRLIVPRIRAVIEFFQFMLLLFLYSMTMIHRHENYSKWEMMFFIYAAGWVLQEFAAIIEHGWELHSQSLWSFLDVTFVIIYGTYFFSRIYDLSTGNLSTGYGLHILCVAAPILLTRVAFSLMPDNIVFISLHAMMKDFTVLTFLAFWCFMGFLLALKWLMTADQVAEDDSPSWATVCKWLLWIWFGLDGTGIAESTRFNVILGPILMVAFAFLGNTLFLTVLVAMLTTTFSRIIANEGAEIRFRRTVMTFEGVKSDSIFSYPPPFNIAALILLLPFKFVVTSRTFHTVNVFFIRLLNAPILLLISLMERPSYWNKLKAKKRSLFSWQFTGFSPHGDIQAVFRADVPVEISNRIDLADPWEEVPVLEDDVVSQMHPEARQAKLRRTIMAS